MKYVKIIFLIGIIFLTAHRIRAQNFDGVWKAQGYGEILDVSGSTVSSYQVTQVSNIFIENLDLVGNQLGAGEDLIGTLNSTGNQLSLTLTGGTVITFDTIGSLPPITAATNDPQINFDIFWQTYEDWCVLFPILSVDWMAEYQHYAPLINANTSDEDLFDYMVEMLSKLNDGHSYLDNDDMYYSGGPPLGELWDDYEYEMMELIEDEYIDGDFTTSPSEMIYYGTINDTIGYLLVSYFDEYDEDGNEWDDNEVFENDIDAAMQFFENTKALIIDTRFNLGGYDSNARILANRLTTQNMAAYSKQARIGGYDEFADSTIFYIQPVGFQYVENPVVVLTSSATLSAADVFAMMAKEIDCVTLIGEQTYGILSDNYSKYLPNGWEFGISPERYKDIYGIDHEQQGIFPDIEVMGSMADFQNDIDNILEVALTEMPNICALTSLSEPIVKNTIEVFPNPAYHLLTVDIDGDLFSTLQWTIADISGKILLQSTHSAENLLSINIENLSNGLYFLNITARNEILTSRFSVLNKL